MVNYQLYLAKEDIEIYEELKKIAHREETSVGAILKTLMRSYVKKHGEGNPNFALDKFEDPGFRAFPTIGEILYPEALAKWDKASLLETAQAIRARGQEIRQELDRRGEPFRWNL